MNFRRKIDALIEENKTKTIKRLLQIQKNKLFPEKLRIKTRNGRLSTAIKACISNNPEVLAEVIRYNKGITNHDLWVCLKMSLLEDKMQSLRFLLKLPKDKFKILLKNPPKNFEPPLFYAQSEQAFDLLLKNGADINQTNSDNLTVLEKSIQCGLLDNVKYLRQKGAFIRDMRSAIYFVKTKRISPEVYNYLQPTPKDEQKERIEQLVRQKAQDKNRQSLIIFLSHKSWDEKKAILRSVQKEHG